ncbi:hypothetical protein B0H10DRAFT_1948416 [Mycena sp. CBHHK59/15]|nr:hypothetical protein B0H10DRAFT_1948416 [Mycena sp. CBHHK59/15]
MALATAGTLTRTIHRFRMSLCLHVVAALSQDVQASFYPPQQWLWYPPARTWGRPGANLFPPGSLQISIAEIPLFTTDHSGQQPAPRSLALPTTHTQIVAGLQELAFVIWPSAMSAQFAELECPELYPIDPQLYGNEDAAVITTLARLNLILRFRVLLAPDGTEDKELDFYSELHTALMKYLADHHLSLSEQCPASAPDRPMPAATDSAGLNTWHVLHLLDYLWTALAVGIKPRPGFRCKLSSAPIAWYDFKISALKVKTVWSSLSDTVNPGGAFYFISKGTILRHALGDLNDEFFRCLPTCPSGDMPSNMTATLASGHSELFILDGAINSDQEEDQVQQAVARSIADAVSGSSSTPGAGPSRPSRPLPPPPMAGIHPRSLSLTPSATFRELLWWPPYVPENETNKVIVELLGQFGLFAKDGSWKSGGSIGEGVGRTIMAELMSTVFADWTVWKDHDSDLVLNLAPPGIIPSFEHLPYALLAPARDSDVIHDFPLVELYAPKRVEVLNHWLSQADFRAKKNDVKVQGLTIQYFNLMPEDISSLSDDMFFSYSLNFMRQVVFGCPTPFRDSQEYSAFAEAFNGPLSLSSELTLGEPKSARSSNWEQT